MPCRVTFRYIIFIIYMLISACIDVKNIGIAFVKFSKVFLDNLDRWSLGIESLVYSSTVLKFFAWSLFDLTHWGRVTHICVGKLISIGSDNGLSPDRRQAIIWTNAGISLIGPLGTNFHEILIKIHTFSLKKMHLKVSSAKRRPFCLGLNELNNDSQWF